MKKSILLTILVLFFSQITLVHAADLQQCKQFYVNILEDPSLNTWGKKIDAWKAKKTDCINTGSYEYYLADIYERSGNLNETRKILLQAISNGNQNYRKWLLFKIGLVEFDMNDFDSCVKSMDILIKENPSWAGGYGTKAYCELALKNYKSAVKNFGKANSFKKTLGAYEGLTLAYYSLKRYEDSFSAFNQAMNMDMKIFNNKGAVLSATYSAFHLKKYDEAKKLLDKLKEYNPGIVNDLDYQKAQNILNSLEAE